MAYIYRIVKVGTDQCYVGHTAHDPSRRWLGHKSLLEREIHHARRLQLAWLEFGAAAFIFEVIEECLNEDRVVREQYYMDTLNSCFNAAPAAGSKLGYKLTEEQLARQWFTDPYTNWLVAQGRRGQKRTPEQRQRMSIAQQNNPLAGRRVGFKVDSDDHARLMVRVRASIAANPMVWITNGKETQKHPTSDPIPDGFRRGRTFSDEHKAAVLTAAGPRTDETKAKMRASRLKFVADNPDRHAEIVAAKRTWEWYTDGTNQQQVAEGETPPAGWRLGMATKRGGVKWVTNGVEGRRIPEGEAPPDGWWFAFPPTKRHPNRVVAPTEPEVQKKGRYDLFDPNEDLDLAAD